MANNSIAIDLAKLLQDAYISTLQADRMGIMEYLRILQDLERMAPLSFGFTDEQGRRQTLQIPVLTLVPLSLLHIEEAEFAYQCHLQIQQSGPDQEVPLLRPGSIAPSETSILTRAYDKQAGAQCNLDEIHVLQSLYNPRHLLFKIVRHQGSPTSTTECYCVSDAKHPLGSKRYVLLSLGRPYVTLWETDRIARKPQELGNYKTLLSMYANGVFVYQGQTYKRTISSGRTIAIHQQLEGDRYQYARRHIAWRLSLVVTAEEEPAKPSSTKAVFHEQGPGQQSHMTNFSFKVRLGQTAIPGGVADVLRVLGNNARQTNEY